MPGKRKPQADQLLRIIAALDKHFADKEQLPADRDRWRELLRRIVRMKDALNLVRTTLREERKRGIPPTPDTARKIEKYARFGLGLEKVHDIHSPDASLEKLIADTKASLEESVALLGAGRGIVAVGEVIAQGGKVGELRMQPSGRWAVCRPGHEPAEITSGELFRVEIDGVLQVRRMEYTRRGYCALGGPPLRIGTRAAIGAGD
jgi:hypothetical protein